jgi:hypothetical protein
VKRTLFLHIGPAKTGTSAIQHVLSHHDSSVVVYPRPGRWKDGSHHNLVYNFFRDYRRPEILREDASELFSKVAEEVRRSDRNIVISSETLEGRDIRAFANGLLDSLDLSAMRVEIVLVAREHFEWSASLYNQRVKDPTHAETADPDDYLIHRTDPPPFAALTRNVAATGFDVSLINYHPAETLVCRFLSHVGFPRDVASTARRLNVSLGRMELVALLAANRVSLSAEQRRKIGLVLQKLPRRPLPPNLVFCADAAMRADTRFTEDRNFVRDKFGIALPVPRWTATAEGLYIEDRDVAQMVSVVEPFGEDGRRILAATEMFRAPRKPRQ